MQVGKLNPTLVSQTSGKPRQEGGEPSEVQSIQVVPPPPPKADKDSSGAGLTGQLLAGESILAAAVEADAPPSPLELLLTARNENVTGPVPTVETGGVIDPPPTEEPPADPLGLEGELVS